MVSQLCACEASHYSCVDARFFRPLPRVFTLSLCVFMYAPRRQQGGKPGRKEKRKEDIKRTWWEGWMDCRGGRGEVPSHPCLPLFRGELRVCIPNEHVGWRSALHNQQTLTWKEPKGASSSYGWTCRTNPMSSQNTSSYARTSGRFETESEGGDGEGGKETQRGKMNRMVRKCVRARVWIHILLAKWGWSTLFKGQFEK